MHKHPFCHNDPTSTPVNFHESSEQTIDCAIRAKREASNPRSVIVSNKEPVAPRLTVSNLLNPNLSLTLTIALARLDFGKTKCVYVQR